MRFLRHHPKSATTVITVLTLIAGAAIVILADFGAPIWVFGLLLLWPATVGLPSTLGVFLAATLWGRVPLLSGLGTFVAACAGLGWLFQWLAVTGWNRWRTSNSVAA